jgi:hypothetical protein
MPSFGMLRRVALVRTDVSEERIVDILLSHSISSQCAANVVPSSPILVTLIMEGLHSCETSVLTSATRRNIPEDDNLQYLQTHILHRNMNILALHSKEITFFAVELTSQKHNLWLFELKLKQRGQDEYENCPSRQKVNQMPRCSFVCGRA